MSVGPAARRAGRGQLHDRAAQSGQALRGARSRPSRAARRRCSPWWGRTTSSSPTTCRPCAAIPDRHRRHRGRNPDIVIARGSAPGPRPRGREGGYDGASFWARGGVGTTMPERPDGWPPSQPTPAFGDVMGGLATAEAIAAALVKRERTGEASVVDVSLLATAMWQISPMIIAAKLFGFSKIPQGDQAQSANPGWHLPHRRRPLRQPRPLAGDKHWADFVERLGVPDMATDPRFADSAARAQNANGVHRGWTRRSAASRWRAGGRCSRASTACGARSRPSTSSTTTCRCRPTATSRP